jgi:ABC-type multidrug transport system ATPase subunit
MEKPRVEQALSQWGLGERRNARLSHLNKEEERRLACVITTLVSPPLLLLPLRSGESEEEALRLAEQCSLSQIVFLTCSCAFAEAHCEYVALVRGGKVLLQGRLEEVIPPPQEVWIRVESLNDEGLRAVRGIVAKLKFESVPISSFRAVVRQPEDIERIISALEAHGVTILECVPKYLTLADVAQNIS